MATITVNGANLYYEEKGSGQNTIVFAHSMLFSLRMFDAQVEALKDRYRCLLFDFRGQGRSQITENGYDLDTLADDTAEIITRLGDPPCHFVGFSMGGMVALRLAIRRPELLRSLILVDTTADPEGPESRRQAKVLSFVVRWLGPGLAAEQVMSLMFGEYFLKDPARQEQVAEWRGHFVANDRLGVTRAVKGVMEREGVAGDLHKIQLPTLIVSGQEDTATVPEKSQQMQTAIEGSQLVSIPRSGHMTPVEEPAAVNAALEAFLQDMDG